MGMPVGAPIVPTSISGRISGRSGSSGSRTVVGKVAVTEAVPVAMLVLLDDHDTVAPAISSPWSSRTRTVRSTVSRAGAHSLSSAAPISTLGARCSGSGTVTSTDAEQLFVVSDSSVTASTHAP